MKKIKGIFFVFLLVFSGYGYAADPAPMVMLKDTSNQMLQELNKNIGRLKNNDKLVYNLVNRILVPHFDLVTMSRAVVGKEHWDKSSSVTQQQFIKEFTCYVIRTYSAALQSYDGEKIKFFPIRGAIGSTVKINSDLMLKNGPPVQLQYILLQRGGDWLIYDFSVDGISITKNYHSQFSGTLRQVGLDGLVKKLHQNNSKKG